ncbi:MAG: transporter substrate-binding domain-containing protein [Alphaproteobacteria bacterium]|nr:transporter substrate-binding domain-containing protein [Alphaproteobacteria bacterium]
MKFSSLALIVVISALTSFGVSKVVMQPVKKETAFERVMRTQTLRCGYIVSPPFLAVDLKTGKKSGLAFDYVNAISKELDLKIEWTEEVVWGTFQEGLKSGRYDVLCVPLWVTGSRAKQALFTRSLYDSQLSMVARADDHRFDAGLSSINKPDVTLATVEGDMSRAFRQQHFSTTKELVLPTGTDDGLYFMNIAMKKADVGFAFEYRMNVYNETAEQKLKLIGKNEPAQSYGTGMSVAHGESDLKFMIDSAIHTLLKSGEAKEIISKYPGVSIPTMK